MKKFLIILSLLFILSPLSAKTIQKVEKYQVFNDSDRCHPYDVTPQLNYMVQNGWKIISITTITQTYSYNTPTSYIIVVYEKEESN